MPFNDNPGQGRIGLRTCTYELTKAFCDKRVYSHHLSTSIPSQHARKHASTQARKHIRVFVCFWISCTLPFFLGGRSCTDKDDFCCNWKKTLLNRNTTIRKTDRHPKTKQPTLALFQSSPSPLPISPESKETTKIGKDKVAILLFYIILSFLNCYCFSLPFFYTFPLLSFSTLQLKEM